MVQTIRAIYEKGIFKPLNPISNGLTEGEEVVINIESKEERTNEIMKLAENFYEGLSEQDIDEIEKIALDRSNFFETGKYE